MLALFETPAIGQEAPAGPGCKGLSSGSGEVQALNQRRKQMQDQVCKSGGPLEQRLKTLQERLQACKDLGKDLQGNTHSLPAESLLPSFGKRLQEACAAQGENIARTQQLCDAYGETAARQKDYGDRVRDMADNPQAQGLRSLSNDLGALGSQYGRFSTAAASEQRRLNDKVPEIKENTDQLIARNVAAMKSSIGSYVTFMENQAKRKLAERQQHAAQTDENADTMRWRTQADVNKFYANLGKCKAAVKEGGDLDRFQKDYDRTLSASLSQAKTEAGTLSDRFKEMGTEYSAKAKEIGDRATGLESSRPAETEVARQFPNPDSVRGDTVAHYGNAQTNASGLDYKTVADEARGNLTGSDPDKFRPDGGQGNLVCFRKGQIGQRVCFPQN